MPRIGIATCLNLPEPDVDQDLVVSQFTAAGLNPVLAAWDDGSVEWSQFDAVVIRSTWDYPERPAAFQEWVAATGQVTQLLNPASIVIPNINKNYLFELQERGISIVPTAIIDGTLSALQNIDANRIVIKPAIGAGSYLTAFFDRTDVPAMLEHIAEIEKLGIDALAQPFMESVPQGGERSLVWIDGEFTHKIVKQPRFIGENESVSKAVPIENAELTAGQRVMDTVFDSPLYARVDLIEENGEFLLNELELIEPSLFFLQNTNALDRLIEGVKRSL
ncbi:MAG: RimK family alpha-L-glutamate ligase [Fimbriimonadaceae bacterium]